METREKKRDTMPELLSDAQERKRSRRKVNKFDFESLDNEEQRMIQQAIRNSQKDVKRSMCNIPFAPVFHPSVEEFQCPMEYISKIKHIGATYGLCKIVPPPEWNPVCQVTMSHPFDFPTRIQDVNRLQEGQGFEDGKRYNIREYKRMADDFKAEWSRKYFNGEPMTREHLCKEYWDAVETGVRPAVVEYGNDLDTSVFGSGFPCQTNVVGSAIPGVVESLGTEDKAESESAAAGIQIKSDKTFDLDFYKNSGWNLNKLPSVSGSLLQHVTESINGVNVPWLYLGMLFASFCWHTEDNYLYSINYSHFGEAKQWYGVPSSHAKAFEKVSKDFLLASFRESPDLLQYMTTQISPFLLAANGVPVYQAMHEVGTFIVTFPQSYHAGFSYGFNCNEAVNFAMSDWLPFGADAIENYRLIARPPIFSHGRLLFTLFNNLSTVALDEDSLKVLAQSVLRLLEEDMSLRQHAIAAGVRDLSGVAKLPVNNFTCIDKQAMDYDEMRACYLCKHICLLSAVACECSRSKVSCLRHFDQLCKCSNNKKFLLCWAAHSALSDVQKRIRAFQSKLFDKSK